MNCRVFLPFRSYIVRNFKPVCEYLESWLRQRQQPYKMRDCKCDLRWIGNRSQHLFCMLFFSISFAISFSRTALIQYDANKRANRWWCIKRIKIKAIVKQNAQLKDVHCNDEECFCILFYLRTRMLLQYCRRSRCTSQKRWLCGANGSAPYIVDTERTNSVRPIRIDNQNEINRLKYNLILPTSRRSIDMQTYKLRSIRACFYAVAIPRTNAINISHWSMRDQCEPPFARLLCVCVLKKSRKIFTAMLKAFYTICTTIETEPNAE